MAAATSTPGHDAHEHAAHHLSPFPLLIGIGVLLLYVGLEYRGAMTAIGLGVFLFALLGWIREDIQFWNEERKDPGVMPGPDVDWYGMIFFLATEVMLFGGLFAVFFVNRGNFADIFAANHEILQHSIGLVSLNTVILLSSGATMHYGIVKIRKNDRKGLIVGLIGTIILGTIFLAVQVKEYSGFIEQGLTLQKDVFGSIFYILTGTHGFHVFLGVVFLSLMLVRTFMGNFTAERHVAVDAFAIYWHFVDVVWIFVYLIIYVGVV